MELGKLFFSLYLLLVIGVVTFPRLFSFTFRGSNACEPVILKQFYHGPFFLRAFAFCTGIPLSLGKFSQLFSILLGC